MSEQIDMFGAFDIANDNIEALNRDNPATHTEGRFWDFHDRNPHVYVLFDRFTREMLNRGYKKSSAWLIFNRVRWEADVSTDGEPFKLSNDFIAYYSRLWMQENPDYAGFFTTRPFKYAI